MELKRKIYEKLVSWKENKSKECLILNGPRQVGKTHIIREFGKNEYESFVEINFVKSPVLKQIFTFNKENALWEISAEEIYKRLTANIPGIKLIPNKTLIFLDEIQKCGSARTALKFLAEDDKFDVIASGSLLGLAYGFDDDPDVDEPDSIAVGYENTLEMYSLDFEEFLWAYGYGEETINYLKSFYDKNEKIPNEINDRFEQLFREYIVVGGMPEVVADFMEFKDFNRVQEKQEKIVKDYEMDINLHAKGVEKVKVRKCYESIPSQLLKENKKFKYSDVEKGKTSRAFSNSIKWLSDSGLVNICNNVYEPKLPLLGYKKEEQFKVYFHDTGLLCSIYGQNTKLAILNGKLTGAVKGGIYENVISELLVKKGYKLYYYKTDNSSLEIEFLIESVDGILPIEVKAGNDSTVSLNSFIEKYKPAIAYKTITGNIGVIGIKKTFPHYLFMFI